MSKVSEKQPLYIYTGGTLVNARKVKSLEDFLPNYEVIYWHICSQLKERMGSEDEKKQTEPIQPLSLSIAKDIFDPIVSEVSRIQKDFKDYTTKSKCFFLSLDGSKEKIVCVFNLDESL